MSNYNVPPKKVPIGISKFPTTGAGWNQARTFEGVNVSNLLVINPETILSLTDSAARIFASGSIQNILNIIDASNRKKDFDNSIFSTGLRHVKIRSLKVGIDFRYSVYLYYESVRYLIDNASNTNAIIITVHPTTYGYLTGTIEPTPEVGGTKEEWMQIVTDATEKQITFATAE